MDQQEALKRLAEIFGGNFTMQPVTTALFPVTATATTFPAIFTTVGCTLDLSNLQTNGDANNILASILSSVQISNFGKILYLPKDLPFSAMNSTPSPLTASIPSVSQTTDRLRTPSASSASSLANSKGPVKRKLFETGGRDMMTTMVTGGCTKEERIDLDDLENCAQMFNPFATIRPTGGSYKSYRLGPYDPREWLADAETAIANGASLNDLLDRPNGEKIPKHDSPIPMSDSSIFGGELMVKRRRKRTNLDISQRLTLDAYFDVNPRPDHERMTEIANLLDLDRDVVRVWFCNRRQKMRRADEPDQPEDALLSSFRAIAQADIAPADPTQPSSSV